ncbi:MAG: aminotransferase class IV [Flavitalea sp.]
MENFYLYNGKQIKISEPSISVESRGVRYGEGVFETIKLINNSILLFDAHMERFFNGLLLLKLKPPPFFDKIKIKQLIIELCRKNNCSNSARIRLSCIGGNGGVWDKQDQFADIIIQAWPLPEHYNEFNNNGLVVDACEEVRKSTDLLSNLKSNNYLPYLYAANRGKELKVNDMILKNHLNHIADSTIANVFIVKDNRILTPMLSDGPVAGVMRRNLLQILPANGLIVSECSLTVDDLLDADEIFLTNAMYGLRWVQRFRDKMYSNNLSQKIYGLIRQQIDLYIV